MEERNMNNKLISETEFLFSKNLFEDNISEDDFLAMQKRAALLIDEFGWENVFSIWNRYLIENCHTIDEVINFANWFWAYGGQEHPIENPYDFLAYFYFILDFRTAEYDSSDILFSLTTTILPKSGFGYAETHNNPDYTPETDSKLIEAVEKLKQSQNRGNHNE